MMTRLKPLVLAVVFGGVAAYAGAQTSGDHPGCGQPGGERGGRGQEMRRDRGADPFAQRLDELKATLKLNAQQETSWNSFVASIKPSAPTAPRARTESQAQAKATTLDRLDKLREARKAREAEFDRIDAATRTFYASLTPTQKRAFDDASEEFEQQGHRPPPGVGPGGPPPQR